MHEKMIYGCLAAAAGMFATSVAAQVDFILHRFFPTEGAPLCIAVDDFGFGGDGMFIGIDQDEPNVVFVPSIELATPQDFVTFGNFIRPRFIRTFDIGLNDGIPDAMVSDGGTFDLMLWVYDGVGQFEMVSPWSNEIRLGDAIFHDEGQDGVAPTYAVLGVSESTNEVRSQIGDGDNPPQGSGVDYGVADRPADIATGVFDSDNFYDALVTSITGESAILLINEGIFDNGNNIGLTWRTEAETPVGGRPIRVVAGFFDHLFGTDGAVATDAPSVALISNGRNSGAISPLSITPIDMAAADFDVDGDLDLIVCGVDGSGRGSIEILLNDGTGLFASRGVCPMPGAPRSISVVDLAGDVRPDIAVACDPEGVFVFRNVDSRAFARTRLLADDGAAGDQFGASVATQGGFAVVGAVFGDAPGMQDCGTAYVYERAGDAWALADELAAPAPEHGAGFGSTVALALPRLLIGSPFSDLHGVDSGEVDAFVLSQDGTWQPHGVLTPSAAAAGNRFGASIVCDGSRLVIGARGFDAARGAAYVFEWNGDEWSEVQMLRPADPGDRNPSDEFGSDVAVAGDRILVGAIFDDEVATDAGAAYVFEWNGSVWTQTQKLMPSNGGSSVNNRFGKSVALGPDFALVGADGNDSRGVNAGACYAFDLVGGLFTESDILYTSDAAAGDAFGWSMALDSHRIMISSFRDGVGSGLSQAGSASIFERIGGAWSERGKIVDLHAASGDQMGTDVAFTGGVAVMGAGRADPGGLADAGAALIVETGICAGGPGATLTGIDVAKGVILAGGVDDLRQSDDVTVNVRSGFGATFVDLHHLDLIVSARTSNADSQRLDLLVETRIDEPAGTAQIRLYNWNTGQFDFVRSFSVGLTDQIHVVDNLSASNRVNDEGELAVSIKEIVFVPFLAFRFDGFFDHVRINVN